MRHLIISLLVALFLIGCGRKTLTPEGYIKWFQEHKHEYVKNKEVNGFIYEVEYHPIEELFMKEYQDSLLDIKKQQNYYNELKGMQYYTLRISKNSENDLVNYKTINQEDYALRVKYFSFDMQNDILLVEGKDTLNCLLHHFERTYGADPHLTFSIGFKNIPESKYEKTFIYYDNVFNNGPIKLVFEKRLIKNTPEIKL